MNNYLFLGDLVAWVNADHFIRQPGILSSFWTNSIVDICEGMFVNWSPFETSIWEKDMRVRPLV